MPGYGISRATHRIELQPFDGSENWVDIRAGRSSGAATAIQSAGLELSGLTADGTPQLKTRINLTEMRIVLFEESIVAWSLKADEGDTAVMPLGRDTYASVLAGDVGTWLDGEITRYYAKRRLPEETLGNSSGSSPQP